MIDFKIKAMTHITAAITSTALIIPIFPGDYSAILGGTGDIYMILRGPTAREIVKVDPVTSSWSNYLTVARGQGGTTAVAWPTGTLLFASTTADGYNEMLQAGQNRVIDYNPNEILTPLYKGEEIYQNSPSGCERWWKSYNGIDPYWDIITGVACGSEAYTDIGYLYDLLVDITIICYEDRTTDTSWEPSGAFGIWTGTEWYHSSLLAILPIGGWETDYRPLRMRVSRAEAVSTRVQLQNSSNQRIIDETKICGPDGTEFDTDFAAYGLDIGRCLFTGSGVDGVRINKIEFFTCAIETYYSSSADGSIQKSDATWAGARGALSGDLVSASAEYEQNRADLSGDYHVYRLFFLFDLSATALTSLYAVNLILDGYSVTKTEADIFYGVQRSDAVSPLGVSDFNNFSGPELSDNNPAGSIGKMDFVFNSDGLSYIKSKLGGIAAVCVREYTYDIGGGAPNSLNWMNTYMNNASNIDKRPILVISGE